MRKFPQKKYKRLLLAAFAAAFLSFSAGDIAGCTLRSYAVTIEYDNLRELLIQGNNDLKNSSSLTNVRNIEYQLSVLREECQSLAANGRIYSSDTEVSREYKSAAASLNRTITQLEKQLDKQTRESASINTQADTLTMSAQNIMVSYLTMQSNADAKELEAEAAQIKYDNTVTRQSAGMATESEVTEAHSSMLTAQTQAASYKQQAESLRSTLLDLLGITDGTDVTIAALSEPDADKIRSSLNYEADKEAAVNNDSSVQSARHESSTSSATMENKENSETEAVGNAESDFDEAYTLVETSLDEYEAAKKGLAAAENTYQGLQRKKNAGMLTKADEISGEAAYVSARATYAQAAMALTSAWDNYQWLVKGIA